MRFKRINKFEQKKSHVNSSLQHCSPFFWKKIFLYQKHPVLKMEEKKIFSRASIIPKILINIDLKIYSGKSWFGRTINKWMVGFKFGEFTWNRKLALYKAKQLKKKKKK